MAPAAVQFFSLRVFFIPYLQKKIHVGLDDFKLHTNINQVMVLFSSSSRVRDHTIVACYLFYFIFCWWCVLLHLYGECICAFSNMYFIYVYLYLYHFDIEIHNYERKMEDYGTSNFLLVLMRLLLLVLLSLLLLLFDTERNQNRCFASPYLN